MSFNGQTNFSKPFKNIKLLTIKTDKFKTSKISVKLRLPLEEQTVAGYALFPYYLIRTNDKFKMPKELSDKLDSLYGAELSASVQKNGDNMEINFSISSISNKLALDGENVLSDMTDIIFDTIFNPNLDGDSFVEDLFKNEKRLALERIEGEINEKRTYAVNTAVKEMCKGEPFGISKYGTAEQVEKITAKSLYDSYIWALKTAEFYITVISADECNIAEKISFTLDKLGNSGTEAADSILKPAAENPKTVSQSMKLNQGKLVIGFRSDKKLSAAESVKSKIMVDVFGGGPYSLLFENVREKQSLCYYCAARYDRKKSIILVDSGVEQENLVKTKEEILKNYALVKEGRFDPTILEASKTAMSQAYYFVEDSIDALDVWYSGQFDEDEILTPNDYSQLILNVSYDDVVKAAAMYSPDIIFTLECK